MLTNRLEQINESEETLLGPFYIRHDAAYLPELSQKYGLLLSVLKEKGSPADLMSEAEVICGKLIDSMELYYSGNTSDAQLLIDGIVKGLSDSPLVVSGVKDSIAFRGPELLVRQDADKSLLDDTLLLYHARLTEDTKIIKRGDMLHIPFDRRDHVRPQRFSIPGLPCYYLSTSSYCCWLEMGKPSDDLFNVCAAVLDDDFRVFNLGFSPDDFVKIEEWREQGLLSYPFEEIFRAFICVKILDIATSFIVKRGNAAPPFQSEYLIPQMLMNAVVKQGYDGISYTSKRMDERAAYPYCINLALFATFHGEKRFSNLCKRFRMTKPVNFSEFKQIPDMRHPLIANPRAQGGHHHIPLAGYYYDYRHTYFAIFDRMLSEMKRESPLAPEKEQIPMK